MKKLLLLLFIVLPTLAFAASKWSKPIESDSLFNATEQDFKWNIAGTADDTSEAFDDCYKYDGVSVWYRTTDTIGTDSVAIYIVLEGSGNLTNWVNLDSVTVTTVTYGFKAFSTPTSGIRGYRFRVNGITGNGSDSRISMIYYARSKWGRF